MKSAQFEQTGLPSEVLKVKEIPVPEPGQGEIRIQVSACNINPSDIMFIRGLYGIRPELPSGAGFEASGVIDKCGEGVSLKEGIRVIFSAVGVWQEYVLVSAKTVIPTPEGMPDEVACQAFINPFTAYAMLEESGLKKGQWLLITAGGSAFGQFVIQLGKKKEINVVCTVRRDSHTEALLELGATVVINTDKESLYRGVMKLTDRNGFDYIFDAVGGEPGARALECLAKNGTMLVFGSLSLENIPLNSGLMLFRNLTVKGFWLSVWLSSLSKEARIKATSEVLGMLASGDLKVSIEARYPLEDVVKAVKHADSSGRKGKVILDLNL